MMLEASGMEHIAKHISFTSGSGSFHENEIANIIEEQLSQTDLPDVEKSAAIKKRAMVSLHINVVDCCMADLAEFVGSPAAKCFKQVFTVIRMIFLPSPFEKLG